MVSELVVAVDFALRDRWSETDQVDRGSVQRIQIAAETTSATSRAELTALGRMAADLNPSPGATDEAQRRIEHVANRGENVVRACE